MPDLSVVCPSFQKASHLRRMLQSMQIQTYPHARFEVLVIDDGSTDETKRVVDEARQTADYRLRYVYVPRPQRANPALCWNIGIVRAEAPVIVHCGADVIAARESLSCLAEYLAQDDGYAYVFGQCYMVHSRMAEALLDYLPWQEDIHALEGAFITPYHHSSYWHVPMLGAIRKERLVEIRGYDESYTEPYPEDEDCWVRLQARGVYAVNAPDVWAAHQYHRQVDPPCGPDCPCPLARKSRTWPQPGGTRYAGTPEDVVRNPESWGEYPGMYEA